jgi:hypothetical protein
MSEKQVKYDGGTVKFQSIHNKRSQIAFVFVEFETKEFNLLYLLLCKFAKEKVMKLTVSSTGLYEAYPGTTGILMHMNENSVYSNVSILIRYLNKVKLNQAQSKLLKTGNYEMLMHDIANFKVYVTGKCKNFTAGLSKEPNTKIIMFATQLNAIAKTVRDNISNEQAPEEFKMVLTYTDKENIMDLIVALKDTPYYIRKASGDSVELVGLCTSTKMSVQSLGLFKDVLQGLLKSWKRQCGAIGSPSAKDTDQSKFKAKCKLILDCTNMMAYIIGSLHGFSFKYKNVEELSKVNSSSVNFIRGIKVPSLTN